MSLPNLLDSIKPYVVLSENDTSISILTNKKRKLSTFIDQKKIILHFVGDGYFDKQWQINLLSIAQTDANGIYRLDPISSFYFSVYEFFAFGNKNYNLPIPKEITLSSIFSKKSDACFKALLDFMKKNNYHFSKPKKKKYQLKKDIASLQKIADYISQNYPVSNVDPIFINTSIGSGYLYFQGFDKNGKKLFIKWGGIGESCKTEYIFGMKFYEQSPKNAIRPRFYTFKPNVKVIATDYQEGITLDKLIGTEKLTFELKQNLINQITDIAKTLLKIQAFHRDIRPENLMLTPEGNLLLIDFQFMVSTNPYIESDFILHHPSIVDFLGLNYAPAKYTWDDIFSLKKVIQDIEIPVPQFINDNVGKIVLKFPIPEFYINLRKCILHIVADFIPIKSLRKKIRSIK